MKKFIKAILTGIAIVSMFSFASCSNILTDDEDSLDGSGRSAFSNAVTYTKSTDICSIVFEGYNSGEKGPVTITKGILSSRGSSKNIYLITLSGTEIIKNQTTGYITDLLSGFCLDNAYLRNVVKIIQNNIPRGSNLVFAGHSLGGMICQQVVANNSIKANYNVLNTVCFGSPLLAAGSREGVVQRLGDTSDIVPYLSGSMFNNTARAVLGLRRENGGYGKDHLSAHTQSYTRPEIWGAYDAVGVKYGGAKLTLDLSTKRFYQSRLW